jgi:hypothetical protein
MSLFYLIRGVHSNECVSYSMAVPIKEELCRMGHDAVIVDEPGFHFYLEDPESMPPYETQRFLANLERGSFRLPVSDVLLHSAEGMIFELHDNDAGLTFPATALIYCEGVHYLYEGQIDAGLIFVQYKGEKGIEAPRNNHYQIEFHTLFEETPGEQYTRYQQAISHLMNLRPDLADVISCLEEHYCRKYSSLETNRGLCTKELAHEVAQIMSNFNRITRIS